MAEVLAGEDGRSAFDGLGITCAAMTRGIGTVELFYGDFAGSGQGPDSSGRDSFIGGEKRVTIRAEAFLGLKEVAVQNAILE